MGTFWDQLKDQVKGEGDFADGRLAPSRELHADRKAGQADRKAGQMDEQADKQEERVLKMTKKHGRGGRRAMKAAIAAGGLRDAADRKRADADARSAKYAPPTGAEKAAANAAFVAKLRAQEAEAARKEI
jgi:hypothetical protein